MTVIAGVVLALLAVRHQATAGPQGQAALTPRIALKATVGKPGSEVRVPVYFDPGDSTVAAIEFRASHGPSLAFVKLELAMRKLQPVATTSSAEPVQGETNVLDVKIANEKEPLPPGPLGWLIFRLSEATAVKELHIRVSQTSATTPTAETVARIESEDAKVVVVDKETADTLLSCFFYMH